MPSFLPEGNRSLPSDDAQRSLLKIVDLLNSGAAGAGSVLVGNGVPGASIPVNKNAAAVYYQIDNAYAQWVWDTTIQSWV